MAAEAPFLLLVNKDDLKDQWEITDEDIDRLREKGWHVLTTSAKSDHAVTEAFETLAGLMLTTP